jgi:hypothetical protein
MQRVVQQELEDIASHALDQAKELSSGTATRKMLGTPVSQGGYGAPYGLGPVGYLGPRGPIPNGGNPAVINAQTGDFRDKWRMYSSPGRSFVVNTSTIGGFLVHGTSKMKARPIDTAVMEDARKIFRFNVQVRIAEIFT